MNEGFGEFDAIHYTDFVVYERTPFTEEALISNQIVAIIRQNPQHAVRSAIRILRARSEQREPLQSQEKMRTEVMFKKIYKVANFALYIN